MRYTRPLTEAGWNKYSSIFNLVSLARESNAAG
jgi:hypothetical protein